MHRPAAHGFLLLVGCALAASHAASPAHAQDFQELAARANAARQADHVPQAVGLYRQALQLKPDWSEGWFYLGTLYYDSDQYPDAEQAFGQFVKLADTPAGWGFLGLCEFETGAYPSARDHLRKAVEHGLPPEIDQVARLHEALLLTRLGLFDEARHWYQPLVRSGSHDPTLLAGLGLNSLERPLLPREIPPDQRELTAAAGQAVYAWLAASPSADSAFHSLVSAYPNANGVHGLYGAFLLTSEPEQAAAELRRELDVNPDNTEARALLALVLVQAGKVAEASPYAKKAAEDRPTSPAAQFAYAQTLTDPRQAAEHLEIAARLDPSNFEYHMALAHVYSKIGRYEDARRERKLSIQMAKESDPHGHS
jgi:tetratricopeptide (TPR) repeat protein